jgi:hypothetical protein
LKESRRLREAFLPNPEPKGEARPESADDRADRPDLYLPPRRRRR